jgi:hypothetical protein
MLSLNGQVVIITQRLRFYKSRALLANSPSIVPNSSR